MTQIAGRLHEVKPWGGVPGRPVSAAFATRLIAAGVPKVGKAGVDLLGDLGWRAPAVFNAIEGDLRFAETDDDEEYAGYWEAENAAWVEHVDAALWAFKEFGLDGLDSMYRLYDQSSVSFADYIVKMWQEVMGE